ncbi:MAG: glycosyltransferase [Bacteroidales bacterium]|nr:glycosyltransferase [Bacteroidales bacterium]
MDSVSTPLVSIAVITYNSSKYVLETLESAKAQTYQNIELIISDDCSTDNTVQLCRDWVEQNKQRFARVQIVESEKNTGVSANCNRAEGACQGEWVKLIAGDDLLLSNCISDFVGYIRDNQHVVYVFGKIFFEGKIKNKGNDWPNYDFFQLEAKEQYTWLIERGNCIAAPSAFYNKNKCLELGLIYDERIPFVEDRPRWINALRKGVRFYLMEKYVVKYRASLDCSISTGKIYSEKFFESQRLVYFYYIYPNLCDKDLAIQNTVALEKTLRQNYIDLLNSKSYRLGSFLLQPLKKIYSLIKNC